jgi:hypothetical protein
MSREPKINARDVGVTAFAGVAVMTTPGNIKGQFGGATSIIVPPSIDQTCSPPGMVWMAQRDGSYRPQPYSGSTGPFSVSRGIRFGEFGQPVSGMAADMLAKAAIFYFLSLPGNETHTLQLWCQKRWMMGRVHTNLGCVDKAAWGNTRHGPTQHSALSGNKKRKCPFGDPDIRTRNRCKAATHPTTVLTRKEDVAIWSEVVFKSVHCTTCMRANCAMDVDVMGSFPEMVRCGVYSTKQIVACATPGFKKVMVEFLRHYRRVHLAAALDPNWFATPAGREEHGAAIMISSWMLFPDVYSVRSSALALTPNDVCKAIRRYKLTGVEISRAVRRAQEMLQDNANAFHEFGRAECGHLQQSINPAKEHLRPWVYFVPAIKWFPHWAEFMVYENHMVTRAFLRVVTAIWSGELALTVVLAPPVEKERYVPPLVGGASCAGAPQLRTNKDESTAYRAYPSHCTEGERVTWEYLEWFLAANRRQAHARVMDPPPVTLRLVGSATMAAEGVQCKWGKVTATFGPCFVELIEMAARGHVALEVGPMFDPLAYSDQPDAPRIASSSRLERMLHAGTIDATTFAEYTRKSAEVDGRQTWWDGFPPLRITAELQTAMSNLEWNETPDACLGLDPRTANRIRENEKP